VLYQTELHLDPDPVGPEGVEPPCVRLEGGRLSVRATARLTNQSGWQDSNLHERVPETRGQPLTHILIRPRKSQRRCATGLEPASPRCSGGGPTQLGYARVCTPPMSGAGRAFGGI
jgi:hypothetical protein